MTIDKTLSEDPLAEFYTALADGDENKARRVHIPRSEVFYARAAIERDLGERYPLDRIERAMFLEGMLDRKDVLDPDRERDWESVSEVS